MPQIYADRQVTIEMLADLGYNSNNVYILRPASGDRAATIIDAPQGSEAVVTALGDQPVERIVVTHWHRDHWAGFEVLREHTDAPVYCGAEEINLEESRNILPLADSETFRVGDADVQVLHTPGHTPGSISLLVGRAVLVGDTLFPGGPGRTRDPQALQQVIDSITTRLHTLEQDTIVLPGHGATTTIGESIEEYQVFASKEHPDDLHGDVLWLES